MDLILSGLGLVTADLAVSELHMVVTADLILSQLALALVCLSVCLVAADLILSELGLVIADRIFSELDPD